MTAMPTHPRTGLRAIGIVGGRYVWPVMGGDGTDDPPKDDPKPADPPKDDPKPADPKPDDKGFPENTPLEQMTVDQREAYWKHQARKHEDMWKAAGKSPSELKDLLEAERRIKEAEDAAKSDLEKANDKATKAEQDAHKARQDALRYKVAAKHGITDEDADLFLTGADEETVNKQAERYVALQGGKAGAANGAGPKVPRSGTGEGSASGGSVAAGRDLYKPRAKKE